MSKSTYVEVDGKEIVGWRKYLYLFGDIGVIFASVFVLLVAVGIMMLGIAVVGAGMVAAISFFYIILALFFILIALISVMYIPHLILRLFGRRGFFTKYIDEEGVVYREFSFYGALEKLK